MAAFSIDDPRSIARAISTVERGGAEARDLIEGLQGKLGRARIVGFTGPPGAGKSTLVDRFARHLRTLDQTVGILAVDPTSPFSGGAILGDRIRMQGLFTDRGIFIRSMATRGAMGGLAPATRDAIDVLDAAGFDWVLVETVGVGQDEVDVVRSVDTVCVVTVPGLGDDIQAIKAGLMEIADVFVINKADRDGADKTERDLRAMLALDEEMSENRWMPPVVQTVASLSQGIPAVLDAIESHRAFLVASGDLASRRKAQLRLRVESLLQRRALRAAEQRVGLAAAVDQAFASGEGPHALAERLFAAVVSTASGSAADPEPHGTAGRGIAHLGIAVASIDEARGLYELLGMKVAHVEEVPHEGVRVAFIPCGDSAIELLEPLSDDSPIAKFLAQRGPGIHHLCLRSADVRADDARLRAAGLKLLRPEPTRGAGGCWVQFVHPKSAGGVLLELAEGDH
jgi:LAO/AO transport system kinase